MLFSIVIPAYKSKYLGEAIESCLSQTYKHFEIVIVDDASPEDLNNIICQYDDPRIRSYRNDKNCGAIDVVDNWNICLSYASGDYVICMGDDDKLLPNCLEEYRKLIEKYPNIKVELIDERFTSKMAFQTMIDSGIGKKARQNKALIDKISATIILENYLDWNK